MTSSEPAASDSPIDRIAAKFGGQGRWAEAIGATQSTIAHWKRRGGLVPARQQRRTLAAARERGIEVTPADFFAEASA
jgi:hypothetical protein